MIKQVKQRQHQISSDLHQLIRAGENLALDKEILLIENRQLQQALNQERRRRKRGRDMGLLDPSNPSLAQFFSPAKVQRAREQIAADEAIKKSEQAEKEERAAARLQSRLDTSTQDPLDHAKPPPKRDNSANKRLNYSPASHGHFGPIHTLSRRRVVALSRDSQNTLSLTNAITSTTTMARSTEWPKDVGRQRLENITAHAKILLHEINTIESIARANKAPAPYGALISILESTKALAQKVDNESVDAILRKFNEQFNAVSLRLQAVETNTDPKRFVETVRAATASSPSVSAWRKGAGSAATPLTDQSAKTSTAPAPTNPNKDDLTIRIRHTNPQIVAPLRRNSEELVVRANQAIAQSAEPQVKFRKALAGKVLPSGDVVVTAANLENAEKLRQHESWVTTFGVDAKVKQRTYGVVIHGISPKTMDLPASARE
ncbi:hypothetical protein ACJ73_10256, partial [Blastomyces percursus]